MDESSKKKPREWRVQFEWHLPSDVKYVREVLEGEITELEQLREFKKEALEVIVFYAEPFGPHHGFSDWTNNTVMKVLNAKGETARAFLAKFGE